MTKLEMLYIRACKTNKVEKRLQSINRRFFLSNNIDNSTHELSHICDKYLNYNSNEFIQNLIGRQLYYSVFREKEPELEIIILHVLISKIRLSAKDDFPEDMMWPCKFYIPIY